MSDKKWRKQLEELLSQAMRDPEKVSAKRIYAVSSFAVKVYKTNSKEVVDVLLHRMMTCVDRKRLTGIYVIDAVLTVSHKKLGRGSYPKLLEKKLLPVFELVSYVSAKDKKQIGKVLGKWRDRGIYGDSLVATWAKAARCSLPKAGDLAEPANETPKKKAKIVKEEKSSSSTPTATPTKEPPPQEIFEEESSRSMPEGPPTPKPPPVTLSLNVSKRGSEPNSASKQPRPPDNYMTAAPKGDYSSYASSSSYSSPASKSGGWGKFVSQPPRQAAPVQSYQQNSSAGWGKWGSSSNTGATQQTTQSTTSSWGGYSTAARPSAQPPMPHSPRNQGAQSSHSRQGQHSRYNPNQYDQRRGPPRGYGQGGDRGSRSPYDQSRRSNNQYVPRGYGRPPQQYSRPPGPAPPHQAGPPISQGTTQSNFQGMPRPPPKQNQSGWGSIAKK